MGVRVAVAGASGYAGGELVRLLAGHPGVELGALTAGPGNAGRPLAAVHPHLAALGARVLAATDPADPAAMAALADADVVALALPHGESAAVAGALPAGVRVLDLGADHRLTDPAQWVRYYGSEHPPAPPWPYGLPELPGARAALGEADRVALPGCYPTAVTLALAPLLAAGLVAPDDVVVVAASGTSGAGATARRGLLGSEVMGDLSAYKVGTHQHTAEIAQNLGLAALSFTPVLAPLPRGILATCTARLAPGVGETELTRALRSAYDGEPFVAVLPPGSWPHTGATLGSNAAHLQATADADAGRAVAVCALDNLGKGAAGQAVQVLNLLLGLPETTGLSRLGVAP